MLLLHFMLKHSLPYPSVDSQTGGRADGRTDRQTDRHDR